MSLYPGDTVTKDPNAVRFYTMDWTAYIVGETITSSAWTITGPDAVLTADQDSILTGNLKTQVRISAGTLGSTYMLTNRIVTSGTPSQTEDRSIFVLIAQE